MNKTRVFCLLLLGIFLPMKAQIYTPNATVQASTNSNVGIGTSTPENGCKIDVNGPATIGNAGSARVYMGSLDANTSFLQSRNTTINKNLSIFADNVGIGTTSPIGQLDVFSSVYQRFAVNYPSVYLTKLLIGGGSYIQQDAGNEELRISQEYGSGKITFYTGTNNMERLRITSGGDVGIGTMSPFGQLDVFSSIYQRFTVKYPSTYLTKLLIGGGSYIQQDVENEELRISQEYGSGKITFYTGTTNTEKMRITSNGFVGIGTANPTSKLTVKGKIHAEEVKVDLAVPADYVFEKYFLGESSLKPDYTLLTLSEVEKFTEENHHLPNVPSAKEIKENGLLLGEMSNVLLQKIEELTLYSIDQKKTIEKLEERLIRLEKDLETKK